MKIVDAVWEERNLGKKCKEIYIEKGDDAQSVLKNLSNISEELQLLFLPIERSEYLLLLPKYGFHYIESNFDLIKRCSMDISPLHEKILNKVCSRQLKESEIEHFLCRLRTDFFFEKDKISIDYHFSQQASANRNYWRLIDYLEENIDIQIYDVLYERKSIGYFILKILDKENIEVYLSGLYPDCRETNLGICIMGEETRKVFQLGAKFITLGVSLNNITSLKVYLSLGYEIKKVTNIFVKHEEDEYVSKR